MTHGTRHHGFLPVLLFAGLLGVCEAQYTYTSEFTSNDILELDGYGRALAMVTSKGFNYTNDITRGKIEWKGFLGPQAIALACGIGTALVCLQPKTDYSNDLFLFTYPSTSQTIPLAYKVNVFLDSLGSETPLFFWSYDAVWYGGSYWAACLDGGLISLTPPQNAIALFYPGRNKVSYTFDTYLPTEFSVFPDSTARAMAVAAGNNRIWLACEQALWSFNPIDTTWTPINDSLLGVDEYYDLAVRALNDTTTILYTVFFKEKSSQKTDTCFYTYNTHTARWHRFINLTGTTPQDRISFQAMTLGEKEYVYIIDGKENEILLYRDTLPDTGLAMDIPYAERVQTGGEKVTFSDRIIAVQAEFGIDNITLADVAYAVDGSDTLFQVATDKGLLFSNNEHAAEEQNTPFSYEYRNVPLAADLEKTYAIPGIINNYHPETVFAYNLKKPDEVTIDIFDYNMDHVVRIVDKASREAGKDRTSGRSTVPKYDRWNGTVDNGNGRPVPPGVYFYRIKTENGRRSFGKVIVAKN